MSTVNNMLMRRLLLSDPDLSVADVEVLDPSRVEWRTVVLRSVEPGSPVWAVAAAHPVADVRAAALSCPSLPPEVLAAKAASESSVDVLTALAANPATPPAAVIEAFRRRPSVSLAEQMVSFTDGSRRLDDETAAAVLAELSLVVQPAPALDAARFAGFCSAYRSVCAARLLEGRAGSRCEAAVALSSPAVLVDAPTAETAFREFFTVWVKRAPSVSPPAHLELTKALTSFVDRWPPGASAEWTREVVDGLRTVLSSVPTVSLSALDDLVELADLLDSLTGARFSTVSELLSVLGTAPPRCALAAVVSDDHQRPLLVSSLLRLESPAAAAAVLLLADRSGEDPAEVIHAAGIADRLTSTELKVLLDPGRLRAGAAAFSDDDNSAVARGVREWLRLRLGDDLSSPAWQVFLGLSESSTQTVGDLCELALASVG